VFWLSIALGLAGFAGCFPRPDIIRITFVVPLVCPLLTCCATRLIQRWYLSLWRYRFLVVLLAGLMIGFCAPYVFFFLQLSQEALRSKIVNSSRGDIAMFGRLADGGPELLSQIAVTPPSDQYFFYPAITKFGFLAAREQVSMYEVLMPGYTTRLQYNDACISVMQRASWVIIDRRMTDPNFLKELFPSMLDPKPPETKRFEQALESGFEFSARYGTFEVRRRGAHASDTLCAGILDNN
jgi:hypothetical protein